MVGNRAFHANDFINQRHILFDTAGNRRRRQAIRACQHPRADPFMLKRPRFRQQRLGMAGHAVGAQQANNGGDASRHQRRQSHLWRPGVGTGFTAAANQVYMLIDKPRTNHRSGEIAFRTVWPRCGVARFFDCDDFSSGNQQIAMPKILGSVKLRIAEKVRFQH